MPFMFTELSQLSQRERLRLYSEDPQSLEEILLYYLCPYCPAGFYDELRIVVQTMREAQSVRDKMEYLMLGASAIRRNDLCYEYGDSGTRDVTIISTYEVKPPKHRLGGLFDDSKLNNILAGMNNKQKLPPMELKRISEKDFEYEVIDGIHRYYSSIKLGHGKLPAFIQA